MTQLSRYLALFGLFMLAFFTSQSQISGTVTVGSASGSNYPCFTCDSGLFKVVNDSGLSGNLEVLVTSNLTQETSKIDLTEFTGTHSITIKPSSAGLKTISFPADSNDVLFNLDSVVNLTIDGSFNGSGRHLAFVSLDSIHPAIQIVRDCQNITIKNCLIKSNNISASGVLGGALNIRSFGIIGNDNVILENNVFERASSSGKLMAGLFVNGVNNASESTTGLQILRNEFISCQQYGLIMEPSAGEVGPTKIMGNSFYSNSTISGPNNLTPLSAIYVNTGNNHEISGNFIGGQSARCGGSKMSVLLSDFSSQMFLLRIGSGVTGPGSLTIDSNIIRNIQVFGATAAASEIHLFHVHANVSPSIEFGAKQGNIIGDLTADASSSGGSSIWFQERFNSSNNTFKVFNLLGSNYNTISKSQVGGIHISQVNSKGSELDIVSCQNADSLLLDSNMIGGSANSIVKKSDGNCKIFTSNTNTTAINNQIKGITNETNFSEFFLVFDIYSIGKRIRISDNTIGNLTDDATSSASIKTSNDKLIPKAFRIINIAGTSAKSIEIMGNQMGSLHITSSGALKKVDFNAIFVGAPVSGTYHVSNNQIGSSTNHNIVQETDGKLIGIAISKPGSTNAFIEDNAIRGITGKSNFANSFTGIDITGEATTSSQVYVRNNVIGDTNTNAASAPSIDLHAGTSGIAPSSYAIQSASRIDVLKIENNVIGGIKTYSGGEELPYISILVGDVKDTFHLKNNQIGSRAQANNMYMSAPDNFGYQVYLSNPDGNKEVIVEDNLFSNINYTGSFNSSLQLLRSTNGTALNSVFIKNNEFNKISVGFGGDKVAVKMIYSSNNSTHIENNMIHGMTVNSTFPGVQFEGINIDEPSSSHQILKNSISQITLSNSGNFEGSATGISIFGAGSDFTINNNWVNNFNMFSSSDKSSFKGILLNSCNTAKVHNNIVLYRNATGSISPSGIFDFANTGSIEIFHNTIDLTGVLPDVPAIFSTCYLKNNDATRKISNNMFNNRMSGGQRAHYAVYFGTSTGNIGCDFNLLYSEQDRDKVVFYTDNLDMIAWQAKGFGLQSINPVNQALVDSLTGRQLTKLSNDVGLTNLGVSLDYVGNNRPQDAGFDLGAFEIPTASLADGILPSPPPTGLAENNQMIIKYFPNPAKEVLFVDIETGRTKEARIYNAAGATVLEISLENGRNKIDLSELTDGFYFLKVDSESKPLQFIVNR